MSTVFITGADRGLGLALVKEMLKEDWWVYAGQFMPEWPELADLQKTCADRLILLPLDVGSTQSIENAVSQIAAREKCLDMLISNAGVNGSGEGSLEGELDTEKTLRCFRINSLAALKLTQLCLPLMREGLRRLCFVTSEAGSISVCTREGVAGYCMSKAALNMGVHLLFNELYPQGYTFRLYHPGWMRTYMTGKKNDYGKLEADESAQVAVHQFLTPKACEDSLEVLDCYDAAWPF